MWSVSHASPKVLYELAGIEIIGNLIKRCVRFDSATLCIVSPISVSLASEFLWIRTLSSTSHLEREMRDGLLDRVNAISKNLSMSSSPSPSVTLDDTSEPRMAPQSGKPPITSPRELQGNIRKAGAGSAALGIEGLSARQTQAIKATLFGHSR